MSGALGSSWNSGKTRIKLFIEALKLYKNRMISMTFTPAPTPEHQGGLAPFSLL